MNIATVLRYCDLKIANSVWNERSFIMQDYLTFAHKYGIGLTAITTEHDFERVCNSCDGLILTGSATNINPVYYGGEPFENCDDVDEYALDSKLIRYFIERKKPIFGVCGGMQEINVYLGGTLKRLDNHVAHREESAFSHEINIKRDSFVYDVFKSERARVNCYHSWELDKVAPTLDIVATTDDGVIEAVESKDLKLFATQWHPEQSFRKENSIETKFFENFLKCCERNG